MIEYDVARRQLRGEENVVTWEQKRRCKSSSSGQVTRTHQYQPNKLYELNCSSVVDKEALKPKSVHFERVTTHGNSTSYPLTCCTAARIVFGQPRSSDIVASTGILFKTALINVLSFGCIRIVACSFLVVCFLLCQLCLQNFNPSLKILEIRQHIHFIHH